MRMNSDANIAMARRMFFAFGGNWENVRKAARQDADGVWVVTRKALERAEQRHRGKAAKSRAGRRR